MKSQLDHLEPSVRWTGTFTRGFIGRPQVPVLVYDGGKPACGSKGSTTEVIGLKGGKGFPSTCLKMATDKGISADPSARPASPLGSANRRPLPLPSSHRLCLEEETGVYSCLTEVNLKSSHRVAFILTGKENLIRAAQTGQPTPGRGRS